MVWINAEALWFGFPNFADVFVWGESPQGFEATCEIVCANEVFGVRLELLATSLMVRFMRSTWALVHGCLILVSRCSMPFGGP